MSSMLGTRTERRHNSGDLRFQTSSFCRSRDSRPHLQRYRAIHPAPRRTFPIPFQSNWWVVGISDCEKQSVLSFGKEPSGRRRFPATGEIYERWCFCWGRNMATGSDVVHEYESREARASGSSYTEATQYLVDVVSAEHRSKLRRRYQVADLDRD